MLEVVELKNATMISHFAHQTKNCRVISEGNNQARVLNRRATMLCAHRALAIG